jgi:hypothetical protein
MLNRDLTTRSTSLLKRTYDLLFENVQWCSGELQNQCPVCRTVVPNHSPSCELDKLQREIKEILRIQFIKVDDTIHNVKIEKEDEEDG